MASLNGKIAVVTGASRGIGRAIALALGQSGSRVAVTYMHHREPAEEVVAMLQALGADGRAYQFDVADFDATGTAFSQITNDFGGLDILVNNAGIRDDQLLVRMQPEAWESVIRTNLSGTFNCARAASRTMLRQRWGRIVAISSIAGLAGNAGQTNYAASKAGMIGFTKSLAKELASRGITVNAVAPGFIDTDMTHSLPDAQRDAMLQQIPMGSFGTPEDVAACVVFLTSSAARYITGEVISVSGGLLI